jgi:hypothetical protein
MHKLCFALKLLPVGFLILCLFLLPAPTHADGGAPNLAYVAGTAKGISVIDIGQQQVTNTLAATGDPQTILLSVDGRLLYVTEPALKRVAVIATYTKTTLCTVSYPGHPTLLTIDPGTNTLYVAGSDAHVVLAFNPLTCAIQHTLTTSGPVEGLAVAVVGGGVLGGNGNQLWVANANVLTVFDATGQQLTDIPLPDGPRYLCIPAGSTAYVTTRRGTVDAIDLQSKHVLAQLLSGGDFGPMDYDAITSEVYVPDIQHSRVDVLSPVSTGSGASPSEPVHIFSFSAAPASIAITSDGQFGFVAVQNGTVVMLDLPGRQVVKTFQVGGNPRFIITGLYPSLLSLTPQQATVLSIVDNLSHYAAAIIIVLVTVIVIIINRRKIRRSP